MQDKLPLKQCRKLIANNKSYSDNQLEQIRDTFYALAGIIVDKFIALKNSFIRRVQTIDAKAFIVK